MMHSVTALAHGIAPFLRIPRTVAAFMLAMVMLLPLATAPSIAQVRGPESVADIAEPLKEAVVNISTTQTLRRTPDAPLPEIPEGSPFEDYFQDFFGRQRRGENRRASSLGSGFVVDPSGLIVTNNHVIADADEITAVFTDGSELKVTEVLGRDAKTDLALLRVEPKEPLPAVKFGDSDKMRVGDWVMAIGNPFGLGGTVTVGVISATKRDIQSGLYDEFLQTDASINRGNSGGPLFNMDGEVIGVNTAIISPTGASIGIGFAVPANTASQIFEQLKSFGETRRGWLGVRIQTVTDEMAESLGLETVQGALVASVIEEGPAAEAGVEVGDVILSFHGQDVTAMRELPRLVAQADIGKEVEIVVLRNGEPKTFRMKVGKLEEEDEEASNAVPPEEEQGGALDAPLDKASIGMTLSPMTDELRSRYAIDHKVKGVVITEIDPKGPAADKSLHPGDIVVEVTQQKVETPEQILERLETLRQLKRKNALLTLSDRQGEVSFVTVEIN